MIGVIAKSAQADVVPEFFELFKTPWEFYREGRQYDLVVVTTEEVPEVETDLLFVYGAAQKSLDEEHGITVSSHNNEKAVDYHGVSVPIYGELAEFRAPDQTIYCLGTAGLRLLSKAGARVVRIGYDLFEETRLLLSSGQPVEHAGVPTLDLHIAMLRDWMVEAEISFAEIVPRPADHSFIVCLTHDIDFVGICNHRFDHTVFGFLYRSTFGAIRNLLRGRISWGRLLQTWRAAASLPFVYLGWAKDFWEPFGWYLQTEKDLPATYFLIPYKGRMGERVPSRQASRRASAYDLRDLSDWIAKLKQHGCELGVHGIDAWHDAEKGRDELERIALISDKPDIGIRIHWLLHDHSTYQVLEQAGYQYDSTAGYNETIGYRNGTYQVFRPLSTTELLELPMHIQDGALFFPQRLDLPEPEAWKRCESLIERAKELGGVLTLLWHDRSHGPERFWGDFYARLVQLLRASDAWFASASQVTEWFRKRRQTRFEASNDTDGLAQIRVRYTGAAINPPLIIRVYRAHKFRNEAFVDISWGGEGGCVDL